jgi:hypothetical protein
MTLIPFPKPVQQLLQELLDLAVDQVFADYDEFGAVRSRAIVVFDNETRKTIELKAKSRFAELATIGDHGFSAINAAGAQRGIVILDVREQGQELIFIFVATGDAKGVCALGLIRPTAGITRDCIRDIALITEIANFNEEIGYDLLKPSGWSGPFGKVDIRLTAEILKFQPRPKPGT